MGASPYRRICSAACIDRGFSVSSVNYAGRFPADVDRFLATTCHIVATCGVKDRWNPGIADDLKRAVARPSFVP